MKEKKKFFACLAIIFAFSVLAIIMFSYQPVKAERNDFERGITYATFDTELLGNEDEYRNIDKMLTIGADWVSFVPIWYQDNATSTEITRDSDLSPTDENMREFIRYFHEKKVRILLKPFVDARDQTWRAKFEPDNWSVWFEEYQNFIWHFANIAEEEAVELFCVGCEYTSSDQDQYGNWSVTIEGIKDRYSGDLIYAADYPSYDEVCFWDLLDFVGIDAYFPLYEDDNPSLSDLIDGWNNALDEVEDWLEESENDDKNVIFTEIGYESKPKCWESPGYTDSDKTDVIAQDMCYKALFSTAPGRSWLEGMFIWWWDNPSTDDAEGGLIDNGWTPKGKPAEVTIMWYYSLYSKVNYTLFVLVSFSLIIVLLGVTILIIKKYVRKRKEKR